MRSDLHHSGKAIVIWPFLLLFIQAFVQADPNTDISYLSMVRADSGKYESVVLIIKSEQDKAWAKSVEFADKLKLPEKIENKAVVDEVNRKINTMFGFYLYKQSAFLKQVDGTITAELEITFEDERMFAIIHNIYFIRYARDRYGKFSPRSSKKYPYGDLLKKQKGETWQNHFRTIDENMNSLLFELHKLVQDEKEASNW